jgi:ABC-type antimicrobial peptide transport system permease subunit
MMPQMYVPAAQTNVYPVRLADLAVRTSGEPAAMAGVIRSAVLDLDPNQPITAVRTLDEILSTRAAERRFETLLFFLFAALAVVLAVVGIFGVVSYAVSQRTPEIGVRMALGADRRHVLSLVVRQGLTMAGLGTLVGVIAALALSRLIESLLFHVKPTDPLTFAAVVGTLLGVAALACYVPAWRATRVDPTQALRAE